MRYLLHVFATFFIVGFVGAQKFTAGDTIELKVPAIIKKNDEWKPEILRTRTDTLKT